MTCTPAQDIIHHDKKIHQAVRQYPIHTFQRPHVVLAFAMFDFGPLNSKHVDRALGANGKEKWDLVLGW